MSHTPGPWAVKYHPETDGYTIHVSGRDWESWGVAHIRDTKEDPHNARLIAAAPDLLAALERLTHPMADDDDLQFALETIAKAKGQK